MPRVDHTRLAATQHVLEEGGEAGDHGPALGELDAEIGVDVRQPHRVGGPRLGLGLVRHAEAGPGDAEVDALTDLEVQQLREHVCL